MRPFALPVSIVFALILIALPLFVFAQTADTTAGGTQCTNPPPQGCTQNPTTCAVDCTGAGFARDGVFGCSTGAYDMSVGTLRAIGGVYVPVNDAAVTQNTGYLVYKFCVLDGIVVREREAATAAYVKAALQRVSTGYNGGSEFPADYTTFIADKKTKAVIEFQKLYNIGTVCSPYQNSVKSAIVRKYLEDVNKPAAAYSCALPNNGTAQPIGSIAQLFDVAAHPSDTALGAYYQASIDLSDRLSEVDKNAREQLIAGQGFAPVTVEDNLPTATGDTKVQPRIVTPGSIISGIVGQMVGSGYRQLESASAVDQIIGALFSGLSTAVLSGQEGLTGLSQVQGTNASYLNQVSADSSSNLRSSVTNNAISIVYNAASVEKQYNQAYASIYSAATTSAAQLKAAEAQCWNLIIPKVQAYAAAGGPAAAQCANPITGQIGGVFNNGIVCNAQPVALHIATSTQFSSAAISSQIDPIAQAAATNVNASNSALRALQGLIADLANTTSPSLQRVALQQLDQLVANHTLHTSYDAKNATDQASTAKTTLSNTVTDTVKTWGDSTTLPDGWCNINNQAVIDYWFNQWKS